MMRTSVRLSYSLSLLCLSLPGYFSGEPEARAQGAVGSPAARRSPLASAQEDAQQGELLVYVGTYTRGESEGIYIFRLDPSTGAMARRGVVSGVANPSFLAIRRGGRFLYAVNEVGSYAGMKSGSVSAFSIDPETGNLTFLNRQRSGGGAPCHLSIDRSGWNVLLANYSGGSVSVVRIRDDGRLGELTALVQHKGSGVHPRRQKGPHAHSVDVDPENRLAFVADLGLDKVLIYRFDAAKGTLSPNDPPSVSLKPGAGPRHFALHPNRRFAYVINELDSTVTAFTYEARRGILRSAQTVSTLPEGFEGRNTTAEVGVHPSGRFLYGSNRGHDSIAVFAVDGDTGKLAAVEHEPTQGKTPRNFGIDPDGSCLLAANQDSDSIVVFRIDPKKGGLEPAGHSARVPNPVCVEFLRLSR